MKKKLRIKKEDEFQLVFKKGESSANRQFVVYVLEKPNKIISELAFLLVKKSGMLLFGIKLKDTYDKRFWN